MVIVSIDNLDAAGLENCYKAAVRLLELAEHGFFEFPDAESKLSVTKGMKHHGLLQLGGHE